MPYLCQEVKKIFLIDFFQRKIGTKFSIKRNFPYIFRKLLFWKLFMLWSFTKRPNNDPFKAKCSGLMCWRVNYSSVWGKEEKNPCRHLKAHRQPENLSIKTCFGLLRLMEAKHWVISLRVTASVCFFFLFCFWSAIWFSNQSISSLRTTCCPPWEQLLHSKDEKNLYLV